MIVYSIKYLYIIYRTLSLAHLKMIVSLGYYVLMSSCRMSFLSLGTR
jgi:hypothetical protein